MSMSYNQMDINVVMYPEITRNIKKENNKMGGMKMTEDDYNSNNLSDIITLNYAMLKSPTKTTLPKDAPIKELKIWIQYPKQDTQKCCKFSTNRGLGLLYG